MEIKETIEKFEKYIKEKFDIKENLEPKSFSINDEKMEIVFQKDLINATFQINRKDLITG